MGISLPLSSTIKYFVGVDELTIIASLIQMGETITGAFG